MDSLVKLILLLLLIYMQLFVRPSCTIASCRLPAHYIKQPRNLAMVFGGSLLLQTCLRLRRRRCRKPYARPPLSTTSTSPPTSTASNSSSTSTASKPSPHLTNKRKAAETILPETQGKKRRSGQATLSSPLKTPPHLTNKRKAAESLVPETHGKKASSSVTPLAKVKTVTLEEIRSYPPPQTRPYYPRTLQRGTRSIKEPRPWTCGACSFENGLTPHLLYDLPTFRCKGCGSDPPEGATDFGFCYGDLAFNETCPIGHVKAQNPNECIVNAVASSVEISHRIMMTILDGPLDKNGPFIDIQDLLRKFRKKMSEAVIEDVDVVRIDYLFDMLHIIAADGVKTKDSRDMLLRISGHSFIAEGDFLAASSALADGHPLIVGFQVGKKLAWLKPGEVYVPPIKGKSLRGHVSVLVGAEKRGNDEFYYMLNAYKGWCRRADNEGDRIRTGIGAIIAEGLDFHPIQILRFNEQRTSLQRPLDIRAGGGIQRTL
ncbi:hypothetical protein BS78_10G001700 [Paspalum vaginatum]|nr:hypothetical protein BS78_10G001700 [Paspalum vaginatum]